MEVHDYNNEVQRPKIGRYGTSINPQGRCGVYSRVFIYKSRLFPIGVGTNFRTLLAYIFISPHPRIVHVHVSWWILFVLITQNTPVFAVFPDSGNIIDGLFCMLLVLKVCQKWKKKKHPEPTTTFFYVSYEHTRDGKVLIDKSYWKASGNVVAEISNVLLSQGRAYSYRGQFVSVA